MTKITAEHLARSAIVYVRQSTCYQVANNLESQRRQYSLVERGHQLGWSDVQVIDDDLGRSGGGIARPGFEKLLAAICDGRVGAVLSLEASRLARNGRDWHTLLEFCGLVDTLIVDEDGVYEPRSPNDRLLLGMKGTMSEMELSMFRQRSTEAIKQKARRGEPTIVHSDGRQSIEWRAPVYRALHHTLTNPVYAGAYAFGRRSARVKIENGRKRIIRTLHRSWNDWEVLIKEHHEGYITWAEFERNQRVINDNANRNSNMGRGSIRRGEALLAGLLRCARCGRKLTVRYSGKGGPTQRYVCRGASDQLAAASCISFGGIRIDRAVTQEVLDRLQPLGIEAALAAMNVRGEEELEKRRQIENALEQARFEAARAHRQYDQVDPDNRLVANELERRWNERLAGVRALEEQLAQHETRHPITLSLEDRERLLALGRDLSRVWNSDRASVETRKKIVRVLIAEIVVDVVGDMLTLVIHWEGGDHTRLSAKRNKVGQNCWVTDTDVVDLVRTFARQMPDESIAAVLNRSGKTTGHGNTWTRMSVCSLRHGREIAPYREGERSERGEMTVNEAAAALAVSPSTIRRMIRDGILPAQHPCEGAPWIVCLHDLKRDEVRNEAKRRCSRRPLSRDPRQQDLDL